MSPDIELSNIEIVMEKTLATMLTMNASVSEIDTITHFAIRRI